MNTTVSRLRRGLNTAFDLDSARLETDRWSIRPILDESVLVDSRELEAVTPRLDAGDLSPVAALKFMDDLYRGHFLPGCSGIWTPIERERLLTVYVRTMIRITDSLVADGHYHLARDCCRAIFSHDPLRERTHRRFMLLLALQGDRNRALGYFQNYVSFLSAECDADPTPETRELVSFLRQNPRGDAIEDRVRKEFAF